MPKLSGPVVDDRLNRMRAAMDSLPEGTEGGSSFWWLWIMCHAKLNPDEMVDAVNEDIKRKASTDYMTYLGSEPWKILRSKAYKRARRKCEVCNTGGEIHAHHKSYANIGYERLADIIVLCRSCHRKFHDKLAG